MKNLKKKNIIIGLIAIVMVMSVGFVVNSYFDGIDRSDDKNKNYSDAFGKVLNYNDLDVDKITYTIPDGITLGNQSWDGFKEKDTRILVTDDGLKITKYDDTPEGRPIAGIPFYQEVGGAIIPLGETDENGKLTIPTGKLIVGESNLIEGLKPQGTPKGTTKQEFKAKSTPIFVDPKIRFLGEVTGKDKDSLPTYKKIAESIFKGDTQITTNNSNVWLKYYRDVKNTEDKKDVQEKDKSQVYISKEPIIKGLTQEQMEKHNLFTGALIRVNDTDNFYYKIRALEGSNKVLSKTADYKKDEVKEITQGSEWNNFILPLVKEHKYNLAQYNWGTLNPDTNSNWVQNSKVRNNNENMSNPVGSADYRAMLTKVPCYEQACFEGEVDGDKFITYNKLLSEITGIAEDKIEQKEGKTNDSDRLKYERVISDKKTDVNLGNVLSKGNDTKTGGNWLKIYDAREGKTLYIAKKPLTNYVNWDNLYKAGVVYGLDMVDKDGKPTNSEINNIYTSQTYQGKIIHINNKPYIVRLLKGNNRKKWTPTQKVDKVDSLAMTQGSEWNRYILPLVKYNRFGSSTKQGEEIEDILKQDTNGNIMSWSNTTKDYKIQYAEYKCFEDLTLNYNNYGNTAWMQEFGSELARRVVRGDNNTLFGAAMASSIYSHYVDSRYGFRPVLEEIPNH